MNHKRIWLAGTACLLALLATQAHALTLIAPPPPGLRIANADVVIVGKVTGFREKLVKGEMYKGDVRDMQIATLKVEETIVGKHAKEIKVGFFPPMNVQGGGGGRPILIGRVPTVQLKQDEETCLILAKHPTLKDVYVPMAYYDSITKKDNPNFAKYVEEIKKAAKLLAKPADSLKSKNADDRFLTAALLVTRYRDRRNGTATEQIPAAESKQILEALAGADWTQKQTPGFGMQGTPLGVFYSLNLTDKDGWQPPLDNTKVAEVAKTWCKDNAGKYRINRFVSDKKQEKK